MTQAFDRINAHGGTWDGDPDHIFLAHSDPVESVKATFAAKVVRL